MSSSRQLAAIMFTDIVGYTSLMGRDEQKAFELLEKNRQIQKPIIEQYNGKWVKELGDGVMASFTTVSDAVAAAIKIQQTVNAAKEFQLRIGIHLGEVVFEDSDVFGDGVNIASRIQAIANPGSIFISESVYNSLSNKKEFHPKFFTEQRLKNVKEPVRIYQVIADGIIPAHQQIVQKIRPKRNVVLLLIAILIILTATYFFKGGVNKAENDQPSPMEETITRSIAVLPFENMNADSSQEFFSDGITETLITDLGRVPGLTVISRNSVFEYKGKAVKPVEVGKQLNVRYILQARMQQAGDMLSINAYLIDTKTGIEKWAKKFYERFENVFSVQDSISSYIVRELEVAIRKEDAVSSPGSTKNLEAYTYYLRGYYLFRRGAANSRADIDSAIIMFEKAISLDPQFALAYAALGKAYTSLYFIFDPNPAIESKAFVNIEKALSLDPNLASAHSAKADLTWTLSNNFPHENAIKQFKRAIDLNPNLVEAHEALASIYFHIGLFEKALEEFNIALTLDPAGKFIKPRIARIHWYQQKFQLSLSEFSSISKLGPGWYREKALVLWYLNRTEEAFKTLDQIQASFKPGIETSNLAAGYAVLYAGTGKKKEAEEKIKIAIKHGEGISHFHHAEHLIASAYALMNNTKAAVEWLQKAADHGLPCYPLFRDDPNLKSLRHDQGYISLMNKLKKQWEYFMKNL